MEQPTLEILLYQISSIQKKYEELAKQTGENYNIFRLLGVESAEVRMHSAILADLLNPKGSHGLGDVFLQLFLSHFEITTFSTQNSTVISEYYIGPKTDTTGGRIDILGVDENNNHLIIENKIYAPDQENQLIRYNNFDSKAPLFYLTLMGKFPTELSIGKDIIPGKHFKCISYAYDIIEWLEQCKREAVKFPFLRETISQYIFLLKHLTNQSTNHKMSKEIVNQIIRNEDTLKAYFEAWHVIDNVKTETIPRLEKDLEIMARKSNINLELYEFYIDRSKSVSTGFSFKSEELQKMNIKIRFEFDENETNVFCFGYAWIDMSNQETKFAETLKEKLTANVNNPEDVASSDSWPVYCGWQNPQHYYNWEEETYVEILSGAFCKEIEKKVVMLLDVAQSAYEKFDLSNKQSDLLVFKNSSQISGIN